MANLGRVILMWVLRHLLALLLILLILIVGRYVVPPAAEWLEGQIEASRSLSAQQSAYAEAHDRFDAWSRTRTAQVQASTAALSRAPETRLRARRAEIGAQIGELRPLRLGSGALALAAASGDSDRVFNHLRAGAEISLLEREWRYIDALLAVQGAAEDRQARRRMALSEVQQSYLVWRAADERFRALNRRPLAQARNFLCENARPNVGCEHYRAMVAARTERDAALAANQRARQTIAAIDRLAATEAAAEDVSAALAPHTRALTRQVEALDQAAGRNWILWVRKPLLETLPTALAILAGVVLGPLLIKVLLYFFIAPLAARRPPIRIAPSDDGEARLETAESAVSQRVNLEQGQELLVVPEAIQSTPHDADKATQWLLSWSMPLSSLASGMVALVRIRSRHSDFVLASATGDPLAEIALVNIPTGSAMVVRPRALRGLIQPIGRPMRISRHWRLAHLSAWLTLQFRYLVFHGPTTLVVQGTRGVRLEPALSGRGINQAATIGFSAGLAYSVRRSEAFGAYLIGKQELFNDSFESASGGRGGWYLYEEMPREDEKGGLWGRGIRGLGDAVLKLFGL